MRGTLGSFVRQFFAPTLTRVHSRLLTVVGAALLAIAALALPASAGASVFSSTGQLNTSSFEGTGLVLAEGTAGQGKYVWVVDRRAGGDQLRGFDQLLGGSPIATATGLNTVVGMGFDPVGNKLFVADRGLDRIFVYPRPKLDPNGHPVNVQPEFSIDTFKTGARIEQIKGLAVDPTAARVGYASIYMSSVGRRVLLQFKTKTGKSSIDWIRQISPASLWTNTVGPGALAVDPVNGRLYAAIDGTDKIQGYGRDFTDVGVPTAHSPTAGGFIALHVDHGSGRLFGVKSDVVEVFGLGTGRYLGSAGDDDFGNANAGFSGAPGLSDFFGTSTGIRADRLAAGDAPTCDTSAPITVVSEAATTLPLECADSDGSTIKEFTIVTEPEHGSADLVDNDGAISYRSHNDYGGADAVSFKVMTRNGPSAVYTQSIEVGPPDTSPPTVTIEDPDDGISTTSPTVPVVFSVNDDRDPSPDCDFVSGADYVLMPGENEVTVSCTDASNNVGQATILVYYDVEDPLVQITSPGDLSVTNESSAILSFSVSDAFDTSPSCDHTDGETVSLTPGENTITVNCQDDAGNTASASVSVYYDDEDPLVQITAPDDQSVTSDSSVTLSFSVSDGHDTSPSCDQTDGETVNLVPGENTITVNCLDNAGNAASASVSVYYDGEAPEIAIDSPADGALLTDPNPDIQYTATDNYPVEPTCTSVIIPDGYAGDPDTGASELAPGTNEIFVGCRDAAGTLSQAQVTVTYDAAAPDVEITDPTDGYVSSLDSAIVNYTVSDDTDAEPSCSLQSGAHVSLKEGANTITVTCTDEAGRAGAASVSVTYSPPVTAFVEPVVRQSTNLEPKTGDVLIKLPGSDEWIPVQEAVNVPIGTVIDTRTGKAQVTLANKDGSTYTSEFWGGIFQVFQLPGDNPISLVKLRDDLVPGANAAAASIPRAGVNPFRGAQIARRGKKRNGLWGSGRGRFRTSGKGGSATVRGTVWYVANYDGGTLFKVARGVVEVRPIHGNCFDLRAGQSRFIETKPPKKSSGGKPNKNKKKKKKKGCKLS